MVPSHPGRRYMKVGLDVYAGFSYASVDDPPFGVTDLQRALLQGQVRGLEGRASYSSS